MVVRITPLFLEIICLAVARTAWATTATATLPSIVPWYAQAGALFVGCEYNCPPGTANIDIGGFSGKWQYGGDGGNLMIATTATASGSVIIWPPPQFKCMWDWLLLTKQIQIAFRRIRLSRRYNLVLLHFSQPLAGVGIR